MTQSGKRFRLLSLLVLLLAGLGLPAAAFCESPPEKTPKNVAILPFTAHAAEDLSYLTNGIRDMLASRLASGSSVSIIEKGAVDQALAAYGGSTLAEQARKIGADLKADYVVTGSLTALGNSLSLDAKVYSVEDTGRPQSFYANAESQDSIIMAIDQLAWNIGENLFGAQRPATLAQTAPAPAPSIAAPPQQPEYQTAHPDRMFLNSRPVGTYGANAPLIRPGGITTPSGFIKSQNFNMGLRGMDAGDVDGDGNIEIVLAGHNSVQIYRRNVNQLTRIGEFSTLARYVVHYVTLADLNGNGRMEIYVSAADPTEPRSFAVEWDGSQFVYLFENQPWYTRSMEVPGEGVILVGQQAKIDEPVARGIYKLAIEGNSLQKGEELHLPKGLNLFDFSYADLDGDGKHEIVAISQGDKLMVLQQNGNALWVSDEYYGGTTRYLGGVDYTDASAYHNHYVEDVRIYVPARIVIRDVNGDGISDVVINKNLSTASRLLEKMRSFPSGEIHALTWNGIGLTELWRTRKIDGYIADYELGPTMTLPPDKDGKEKTGAELFVGLILKSGGLNILKGAQSTVLTYQLEFANGQEEEK